MVSIHAFGLGCAFPSLSVIALHACGPAAADSWRLLCAAIIMRIRVYNGRVWLVSVERIARESEW